MRFLILEEFKLLIALFVLNFFAFSIALLNGLDLGLEFNNLVLLLGLSGLEVGDSFLKIGFAVLGL